MGGGRRCRDVVGPWADAGPRLPGRRLELAGGSPGPHRLDGDTGLRADPGRLDRSVVDDEPDDVVAVRPQVVDLRVDLGVLAGSLLVAGVDDHDRAGEWCCRWSR